MPGRPVIGPLVSGCGRAFRLSGQVHLISRCFYADVSPLSALTPDSCRYPRAEDLQAFKIPHGKFVKLHAGTWHAGPLFQEPDQMDFYNLELKDTNVVDHNIHVYSRDGLQYELEDLQD